MLLPSSQKFTVEFPCRRFRLSEPVLRFWLSEPVLAVRRGPLEIRGQGGPPLAMSRNGDEGWLQGLTAVFDGTACSVACNDVCAGQSKKQNGDFFAATRPPQPLRQHLSAYSTENGVGQPAVGSVGILWNVEELDFWGPSLVVAECVAGGPAQGKGIHVGE